MQEELPNTEIPQAVTNTTIFEAASLSKPVFAFIVLKMIEEGKFSVSGSSSESGLNRPLYEICAFGPPLLRQHAYYMMLTVQRILSHQAGLPNWFEPKKPEEYLTEPGTRFDYSGVAFCFLKEVVEYLSGTTFEVLAKQLFKQLEMNHSSFLAPDELTLQEPNFATGHDTNNIPDKGEHFPSEFGANPAASLHTTTEDYAKFLRACVTDPFIKEHMFKSQIQLAGKDSDANVPQRILEKIDWGIGIGLQTLAGNTIAFHWGDNITSRSFAAINLRTNQAAMCFTNSANGPSVFQQIVEPVVGSIYPVAEWLSHREGLPFQCSPTSTYTDILKSLGTPAGLLQEFDEETSTTPMIEHESVKTELPLDGLKRDLLKPDTVEHMPRAPENNIDVQDVVYDGKTFSKKSFFLNHDITAVTSTEESEILFKIASISKTMVAALVFKLQELGVLQVSDPITNFLSYANDNLEGVGIFPELAGITIEDLLRHTSGLQDYTQKFDDKQARHDLLRDDALRFTPQEKYSDKNHHYSNTNYLLIGKILDTLHRRLSDIDPTIQATQLPR